MTKPAVWFPRKLSSATMQRAARDYDIIVNEADTPGTAEDIIAMSRKVDAMVPCHSEHFSAEVVAQLDARLKIIANHSVGTDHCDLNALASRGIVVTNTPDVLSDATAEIAMLLLLGAARRAVEGDALVRSGEWDFWSPAFMVGKQLTGAKLGIVGMGRVGKALARKAQGFDMELHYHNRTPLPENEGMGAIFHETLESMLPHADFLSLHCPATPQTRHLLNRHSISLLPKGAIVVNTARGALIDETALLHSIRSGHLSGAGLDCFEKEPGGNPAFAAHTNIVMLPHIGSATVRTRDAMGFRALDNLDAFFAGKSPKDRL